MPYEIFFDERINPDSTGTYARTFSIIARKKSSPKCFFGGRVCVVLVPSFVRKSFLSSLSKLETPPYTRKIVVCGIAVRQKCGF